PRGFGETRAQTNQSTRRRWNVPGPSEHLRPSSASPCPPKAGLSPRDDPARTIRAITRQIIQTRTATKPERQDGKSSDPTGRVINHKYPVLLRCSVWVFRRIATS